MTLNRTHEDSSLRVTGYRASGENPKPNEVDMAERSLAAETGDRL